MELHLNGRLQPCSQIIDQGGIEWKWPTIQQQLQCGNNYGCKSFTVQATCQHACTRHRHCMGQLPKQFTAVIYSHSKIRCSSYCVQVYFSTAVIYDCKMLITTATEATFPQTLPATNTGYQEQQQSTFSISLHRFTLLTPYTTRNGQKNKSFNFIMKNWDHTTHF